MEVSTTTTTNDRPTPNADDAEAKAQQAETERPPPRCVSCSSDKIAVLVRDKNFTKVIRFYWDSMLLEVKPLEYRVHDLCKECFHKLVDLYDSNEMTKILDHKYSTLQKEFIEKTVKSLKKIEAANTKNTPDTPPLGPLQQAILEKWRHGCGSKLPDGVKITGTVTISSPSADSKHKEPLGNDTSSGSTSWSMENLKCPSKNKPQSKSQGKPTSTRTTRARRSKKQIESSEEEEEMDIESSEEEAELTSPEEESSSESASEYEEEYFESKR